MIGIAKPKVAAFETGAAKDLLTNCVKERPEALWDVALVAATQTEKRATEPAAQRVVSKSQAVGGRPNAIHEGSASPIGEPC